MQRIASKSYIDNILRNINKSYKKVQDGSLQISSGKKINKPSDDPIGIAEAMSFKNTLSSGEQFKKNINKGRSWLNLAEGAFSEITNILSEVKTVAVQFANGSVTDKTVAVTSLESYISDLIRMGNTQIENRYIFGGQRTDRAPFAQDLSGTSGTIYFGSNKEITAEFDFSNKMAININGTEFFAADLNPNINGNTSLQSLNRGLGVSIGSFSITDRAGASANINLSGLTTITDVINTISNNTSINVTARINNSGTGITIEDDNNSDLISGKLVISEVGNGRSAKDLGILGSRYGDLSGKDLDPEIDLSTPLSLLNAGDGLSLSDIEVENGGTSGAISFTSLNSSSTIGELINIIDSSGLNIVGGVNSNGSALTITSTNSSTVATISEIGSGTTASELGIGGAKNILLNLQKLKEAVQKGDRFGISAVFDNLDKNIDNISRVRGIVGTRINRLEASRLFIDKSEVDTTSFLSDTEDVDFEKASLNLITFQNAYQVSLSSSAQVLRLSILDFLR